MATENELCTYLKLAQELVYNNCNVELTNLKLNSESAEYGACSFKLNGHKIEHRISKITPTKTGQFVTIWKRNKNGITEPFDIVDNFDFVVITSKDDDNFGQFLFPKSVLADKGIISQNRKNGKRGIRVYPSWDSTTNKQAEKTQNWQTKYFVEIKKDNTTDIQLVKQIFNKANTL